MSGLDVFAVVSCVAGLIQALDTASRIVKQIKASREVHHLIEAMEEMRRLERIISKENVRFGSQFEAGDNAAEQLRPVHSTWPRSSTALPGFQAAVASTAAVIIARFGSADAGRVARHDEDHLLGVGYGHELNRLWELAVSYGQNPPPAILVPTCAIFGLCLLSLANTQKQHKYIDSILFTCAMIGIGGAALLSHDLTTFPVWLCRIVPGALLAGQVMSMVVGIFVPEEAEHFQSELNLDEVLEKQ